MLIEGKLDKNLSYFSLATGLKVFNGETVDPWVDTNAYQFKAPDVDVMSRSLRADEDQAFSTLNEFKYSAIQRGITKVSATDSLSNVTASI